MAAPGTYTIGKVVKRLQVTHPTLSVSKVRYLESEGIVHPKRTKSGYRTYSDEDVARLDKALRLQEQYFYPLHVIKVKLDEPAEEAEPEHRLDAASPPTEAAADVVEDAVGTGEFTEPLYGLDDACALLDVPSAFVRTMCDVGIIALTKDAKGHPAIERADMRIIRDSYELKRFGLDPRFIKPYLQQVNRETPVIRQILQLVIGRQGSLEDEKTRASFDETLGEIAKLTSSVHEGMLIRALMRDFTYPVTTTNAND